MNISNLLFSFDSLRCRGISIDLVFNRAFELGFSVVSVYPLRSSTDYYLMKPRNLLSEVGFDFFSSIEPFFTYICCTGALVVSFLGSDLRGAYILNVDSSYSCLWPSGSTSLTLLIMFLINEFNFEL